MKKKFIKLLERDSVAELAAYFAALPDVKPLDLSEEMELIKRFPELAVKAYIARFRFCEDAEISFIGVAPPEFRAHYINHYGLYLKTQEFIISHNLLAVGAEFLRMRPFDCVDFLLENGTPAMIRLAISKRPLDNDEQIVKLLKNENQSLFKTYVDCGHFVSDSIIKEVVGGHFIVAFNALVYRNYRNFKKAAKTMTFEKMKEKKLAEVALPEALQLMVIETFEPMLIEPMLKTTPLAVATQKKLFEYHFDASMLKMHVSCLYGVAGYRFEKEMEEQLLKLLASKSMDDCLLDCRPADEVTFISFASVGAVLKFIKNCRIVSDEGQVAVIGRGNADIIRAFIKRFTPEYGMCWQAEVKMAEICSAEVINEYTVFHSMCSQALDILRKRLPEALDFYYAHHAY